MMEQLHKMYKTTQVGRVSAEEEDKEVDGEVEAEIVWLR